MKKIIASIALFAGLSACVKVLPTDTGGSGIENVQLRATITADNHCTVQVEGKTYQSTGQVRGATLPAFVGATNLGYHEVGCWVGNLDGSDGSISISFSGNSFNKPFEVGSFLPRYEAPAATADHFATVTFQGSSFPGRMFRTDDSATGVITVDGTPTGAKTITVDVTARKLQL